MLSAEQLKALGIASWHHPHARYYERLFTNLGWDDKQITEALKFGATYRGDGTEEHLAAAFRERLAPFAPDLDAALDAGLGLRDNINQNGLEALPDIGLSNAPSFSKDDAARLAEMRQLRRDDPHAWESNKAMQQEELALIEAQLAAGAKATTANVRPAARPSAQVAQVEPPSGDRLSQIREMRRNDPDAYDLDCARLEAEELSLIEASLPTSTGNDFPVGDVATPQTEQGAA